MENKVIAMNPRVDGINAKAHRKEDKFYQSYEVVAIEKGKFFQPISIRLYYSGQTAYCCIWIHGKFKKYPEYVSISGSGKAGGYGYHKASAAMQNALISAGIGLNEPIDGVGESAMRGAIEAICKHLGIKKYSIVNAHG